MTRLSVKRSRTVQRHLRARPINGESPIMGKRGPLKVPALVSALLGRNVITLLVWVIRDTIDDKTAQGAVSENLRSLRRLLKRSNSDARPCQQYADDCVVQITTDEKTAELIKRHAAVRRWEYALAGSIPRPVGEDRRDPFARTPTGASPAVRRAITYKRASMKHRTAIERVEYCAPGKDELLIDRYLALHNDFQTTCAYYAVLIMRTVAGIHRERVKALSRQRTRCPFHRRNVANYPDVPSQY